MFAGDGRGSGHAAFLPAETRVRHCIQYSLGDGLLQEPSSPPAWKGAPRSLPAGSSQPWGCLSADGCEPWGLREVCERLREGQGG